MRMIFFFNKSKNGHLYPWNLHPQIQRAEYMQIFIFALGGPETNPL